MVVGDVDELPGFDAKRRKRRPLARVIGALCWMSLVLMIACWLLQRFAAERWWPATCLLFGPKWLLATMVVPLLLAAVVLRLWRPTFVAAVALGILVFPVLGFRLPAFSPKPSSANAFHLRVLTNNVNGLYHGGPNWAVFNQYYNVDKPAVDVVAMQEWEGGPVGQHEFDTPTGQVFFDDELRLWSRYPTQRIGPVFSTPGYARGVGVAYEILTPAGPVVLINLHLASPHDAFRAALKRAPNAGQLVQENSDYRQNEIRKVAEAAAHFGNNVILVGDFNLPAESMFFRQYLSNLHDAFTQGSWGFGWTYLTRDTVARIDHVMTGFAWTCRSCQVTPCSWSPHSPMRVNLELTN